MQYKRNWPEYNKKLIQRGEFYVEEGLLEKCKKELKKLNKRKEGRPFQYANCLILFLGIFKVKFRMSYRFSQGFFQSILTAFSTGLKIPYFTSIFRRMSTLKLNLCDTTSDLTGPLFISIDGSGLRADHGGSWLEKRFGCKRKRYLKIIFAIDVKSKKIIELAVTTDKTHENRRFRGIVRRAAKKHILDKVAADPGFDDYRNYEILHKKKARSAIKPKNNANPDYLSHRYDKRKLYRQKQVLLYQKYSYESWKKKTGYNYRTLSESCFSAFKANFGEGVYSKKFKYAKQEVLWKAYAYNQMR